MKMEKKSKDVEELLKDRQDERVQLLEESIQDIKDMIKERGALHKELLSSLDKIDIFINNEMPKQTNVTSDAMVMRQELAKELLKKKIELEELKIQEKLNYWRDVALLKRELREHTKEIRDMQSRTNMIGSLMDM